MFLQQLSAVMNCLFLFPYWQSAVLKARSDITRKEYHREDIEVSMP